MKFAKYILIVGVVLMTGTSAYSQSYLFENEKERELVVELFPNPTIDAQVTISADKEIQKIELLNIVGQPMLKNEPEPSTKVRLELGNIKNGIYIVRITFTDNTGSTKRLWVK